MCKGSIVISAFPGCGKTYFTNNSGLDVSDSDSSKFSWLSEGVRNPDFPKNYIEHIKSLEGKVDFILVSSHREVREALVESKIPFHLVYPDESTKTEYIDRYKRRGSSEKFIELLTENWEEWINELRNQTNCLHFVLNSGQYLSTLMQMCC